MSQAMRQALLRAGTELLRVGRQAGAGGEPLAAAAMAARPLSSLISLRAFHWQRDPALLPDGSAAKAALVEALPPWTPTKDLAKRKTLTKRMGHLLQVGAWGARRLWWPGAGPLFCCTGCVLSLVVPALPQVLEKQREEEAKREKPLPDFRAGDVIELKLVSCPAACGGPVPPERA